MVVFYFLLLNLHLTIVLHDLFFQLSALKLWFFTISSRLRRRKNVSLSVSTPMDFGELGLWERFLLCETCTVVTEVLVLGGEDVADGSDGGGDDGLTWPERE
nr:hypothetical protein [Tanacetum cinerariifolium]